MYLRKEGENSRVSCKSFLYLLQLPFIFCMLVSIGLFGSTAVARGFYLCTILKKIVKTVLVLAVCITLLVRIGYGALSMYLYEE